MLNSRRSALNYSWRKLGRELSIDQSVFSRMKQNRNMDCETLLKLMLWLDIEAKEICSNTKTTIICDKCNGKGRISKQDERSK